MELNVNEIISVELVSLQSPFYGKIYFRKECPNNWVSKVKGQVIFEGEIIEFGCKNFNCERGGRCGCAAPTIHIFTNKPAGSSISVSSQYCYEGQWLEVSFNLVFVGNNQYNLYGTNPATGEYNYFGFVKFIPTQPPDCPNANNCSTPSSIIFPPLTTNYEIPIHYEDSPEFLRLNRCELNQYAAGFFTIADTMIADIIISDYCFNNQTQKWEFEIVPIKIKTIYGLCTRDDFVFISSIDEIPDDYLCPDQGRPSQFLIDLWAWYDVNWGVPRFLPRDLVVEEELIHFNQFVEIIRTIQIQDSIKKIWQSELDFNCPDFISVTQVENIIKDILIKIKIFLNRWILINTGNLETQAKERLRTFVEGWNNLVENEIILRNCR